MKVEPEAVSFLDGLFQSIHTRGLSDSAGNQLFVFGQYDGVALAVFHNFVGKQHIFDFRVGCSLVGHLLQAVAGFDVQVAILHKHTVEQRAELFFGQLNVLTHEDDAVLFLFKDLQSIHVIVRSNDDFEENLIDFLSCGLINRLIGNEHAAKRRNGVTGQCILPGLKQRVA